MAAHTLADVCGVSRRSVHLWASGKSMSEGHEEHLRQTLAAVRAIDRGKASANRALLLSPGADDVQPLELLRESFLWRI
ncbi:MAG: hypothetical protein ACNA8W_14780 [Bradymonadaceae bacterium]